MEGSQSYSGTCWCTGNNAYAVILIYVESWTIV